MSISEKKRLLIKEFSKVSDIFLPPFGGGFGDVSTPPAGAVPEGDEEEQNYSRYDQLLADSKRLIKSIKISSRTETEGLSSEDISEDINHCVSEIEHFISLKDEDSLGLKGKDFESLSPKDQIELNQLIKYENLWIKVESVLSTIGFSDDGDESEFAKKIEDLSSIVDKEIKRMEAFGYGKEQISQLKSFLINLQSINSLETQHSASTEGLSSDEESSLGTEVVSELDAEATTVSQYRNEQQLIQNLKTARRELLSKIPGSDNKDLERRFPISSGDPDVHYKKKYNAIYDLEQDLKIKMGNNNLKDFSSTLFQAYTNSSGKYSDINKTKATLHKPKHTKTLREVRGIIDKYVETKANPQQKFLLKLDKIIERAERHRDANKNSCFGKDAKYQEKINKLIELREELRGKLDNNMSIDADGNSFNEILNGIINDNNNEYAAVLNKSTSVKGNLLSCVAGETTTFKMLKESITEYTNQTSVEQRVEFR